MTGKIDTIIVGGGIGGAALGALLAGAGRRVLLLEKNSIIGGRCASYERDGFVVDVGVHLFGEGEKGPLAEVCRRAGKPGAIEWVVARNPRVAMHYQGKTQNFTRELMMANVSKKELGPLANAFVQVMTMKDPELDQLWYTPLTEWLYRFTRDRQALGMFAMLCGIYLCVGPDQASTAEFILCLRGVMKHKSSGYPKGGCVAIPRAYQQIIEERGGEVRLSWPVERVIIENGRAKGVVARGESFFADRVVINADIKVAIGGLAEAKHFPAEYVDRVQKLTYTSHVLALKVALNQKVTDQKMIMYMPNLSEEEIAELERAYLEGGPMPMVAGGMLNSPTNFDPALAPPGKQLLFFGTRCERSHDFKAWEPILLSALEEMFPGVQDQILWTALDSPDVVERYAGEDGNIVGVGQTIHQVHARRPTHETPVKGLYLCSAEAGGHGIGTELAASSALELAEKLLAGG